MAEWGTKKVKYITNKELLGEIQRSKATYCHFTAPEYSTYDAVVTSTEDLTQEFIAATFQAKVTKLAKASALTDISEADVVFRVMTDQHLPEEFDEKRRKRSSGGGWVPRTNFPPFQHFVLHDDLLIEVGRSHWKGDLESGQFCAMHGKITERLASMFLLLVEQYSRRGNWRGYCLPHYDEAMTQRGWLNSDQITENDMILSYDNGQLKWSKIKSIYRDDFDGKMFHLTSKGFNALVTEGHRFVTDHGMKPVEHLDDHDKLILMGRPVEDGPVLYDNAFVELVGWFVTEGNYYSEKGRNYRRVTLYQNEGVFADRIRMCFTRLNEGHSEYHRPDRRGGNQTQVAFHLRKKLCEQLLEVAPDKVLSMPFILSLSQQQRELLIQTMMDGDGFNRMYAQKDKSHVDAFVMLCTLAGYRTRTKITNCMSFGKPTQIYLIHIYAPCSHTTNVSRIDFHGGKGVIEEDKLNQPTVDYRGRIWCPETEYGSFVVRHDGYIFVTSNSYVSDMRGQALVQLSQVGLQFDESRSDNPFAWYTQIIKNSFRRTLLLEKRNQDIRDDLLVMAGAIPSFTRQVDDDLEQKAMMNEPAGSDDKKEVKKRGRKPKQRD
jgi:hypothetical protein